MTATRIGLVALGDSVSAGVGDPGPEGLRGWVHYLAANLPGTTLLANLSRAGATVSHLRRGQLEPAIALKPDLATCVIGVNDVIQRDFRVTRFERDYEHVVATLAATVRHGTLTMTLHDVASALPLPRGKRAAMRRRIAEANEVIERVSERHGAWTVDARKAPPMQRVGMLSLDRLHPNRRGHRYIAAFDRGLLYEHGLVPLEPSIAVPDADPLVQRIAVEFRHVRWLTRHLGIHLIPARRTRKP